MAGKHAFQANAMQAHGVHKHGICLEHGQLGSIKGI